MHEPDKGPLANHERVLAEIVSESSDAVVFLDNEQRIISWNRGAVHMFGYEAAEIIGKFYMLLVPQELQGVAEPDFLDSQLESRESIEGYETRRMRQNGKSVYVELSRRRITNPDGEWIATAEIMKNIQARKELEFELLRTILELSKINELNEILHSCYEERDILELILVAMTAGEGLRFNRAFMLLVDPRENCLRGQLAIGASDADEANRIWSDLKSDYHYLRDIVNHYRIDRQGTDRTVNELVGSLQVPLENKEQLLVKALEKRKLLLVQGGRLQENETADFTIGDRSLCDLLGNDSFVVAPLLSKKVPLGVLIADNCITREEISVESLQTLRLFAAQAGAAIENARLYQNLASHIEKLQHSYSKLEDNQQKLLQSQRLAAIGEMSAQVAHEIRNPLVAIGGFARLIERTEGDGPLVLKYAGIIAEQTSRLELILNNLLSTSKSPQPHLNEVDLIPVIEETVNVARASMSHRIVDLHLDLPPIQVLLVGDKHLLHQMLLNLLLNALEACEQSDRPGRIDIALRQGESIELEIRDNGIGMEEGQRKHVFDSFFSTKAGGTGLGLSIVRQIVQSHQGSISLRSAPGEGSCFTLRFPHATIVK